MIPKRLLKSALLIRRVARVNSGGKVRTVSALVAVGNGNGMLGIGMGRGKDGQTAVRKAAIKAESEMVSIPRLDQRTIYHDINFKYHSVKLLMRVAKPGILS
jgi:small subunit ribosomal protein S5